MVLPVDDNTRSFNGLICFAHNAECVLRAGELNLAVDLLIALPYRDY